MAYPFIPGSQSEAFKGMTILLGVLLSIGSSSIIANIVAGYSMAFRRAFKIGDRIRVGDTVGLVAGGVIVRSRRVQCGPSRLAGASANGRFCRLFSPQCRYGR